MSVFMLAAQTGCVEMLRLLDEYGADVDYEQPTLVFADGYPYGGITALMCAGMHADATRYLLDEHCAGEWVIWLSK